MKARDVANYLLFVTSDSCSDVTNMKINKLVYFAQGHALQQGFSLFEDRIVAGDHGPMVEDVYHLYEKWGKHPISEWDELKAKELPDDIRAFLVKVAGVYASYSAAQLRRMTHQPGTPWKECYVEGGQYRPIPKELIKEYFDKNVSPLIEEDYFDSDFVGYRDEEGYLVLPADMR